MRYIPGTFDRVLRTLSYINSNWLEGSIGQPPKPINHPLGTPKILRFWKSAQKILKLINVTMNKSEIMNINLLFSFYVVVMAKSYFRLLARDTIMQAELALSLIRNPTKYSQLQVYYFAKHLFYPKMADLTVG
jgi:hypothetical protein